MKEGVEGTSSSSLSSLSSPSFDLFLRSTPSSLSSTSCVTCFNVPKERTEEEIPLISLSSSQNDLKMSSTSNDDHMYHPKISFKTTKVQTMILILNFIRDFVWTFLSVEAYDEKFYPTTNLEHQIISQWIYSTLAMFFTFLIIVIYLNKSSNLGKRRNYRVKEGVIILCAASLSVIAWDYGQSIGIQIGMRMGMNVLQAGYFAAIFTGLAEGPTQYFVFLIGTFLVLHSDRRQKYTDHKKEGGKRFITEVGYSLFPGMIPGGIWQIAYNGNPFNAQSTSYTGLIFADCLLVAFVVCTANYVVMKISEYFFAHYFPTEKKVNTVVM